VVLFAHVHESKKTIENKLDDEIADRGVYTHMIQRLTVEVQDAKLISSSKEKELAVLQSEIMASAVALQTARQEKCAAELLQKKLGKDLIEAREENNRAIEDLQLAIDQTKKKYEIIEQREYSRKKVSQNVAGISSIVMKIPYFDVSECFSC